ncbi:hypothetical protein L484_011112 [Morus notabilis]|uniref:Uncharacterized protein n=1 Tax=Morus notabilis TaxID=981085 RepID=W9R117_9ROSA|nr:hypothetical protein L484_011112 [Morus notabilis]
MPNKHWSSQSPSTRLPVAGKGYLPPGDETIDEGGIVIRGGRGRLKSPPGSGWVGGWMEWFGLLGSIAGWEGLVTICLMSMLRDPTVAVVGFVPPSEGGQQYCWFCHGVGQVGAVDAL